ncbi:MAG: type II toxin-antitoxin system RelE/ParE family toxin [Chloroflexota bacterium]
MSTPIEPDSPAIEIRFTPEFKRNLRALAKRYRHIRSDLEPVLNQLRNGEAPGDQIPGTGYTLYKVRIRNSDARRGKSGGYRIIYYIQTPTNVVLITLYSKSDQSDVSADEVRQIIRVMSESS